MLYKITRTRFSQMKPDDFTYLNLTQIAIEKKAIPFILFKRN